MKLPRVIFLLVFIYSSATIASPIVKKIESASEKELEKIGLLVSETLSADLPQKIDAMTNMNSMVYVSSTKSFIYNYDTQTVIDKDKALRYLVSHTCNNPVLNAFMDRGNAIIHKYNSPKNSSIFEITAKDCNSSKILESRKVILNCITSMGDKAADLIIDLNNNTMEWGPIIYDIVHKNDLYISAYERSKKVGGETWVLNRISGEYHRASISFTTPTEDESQGYSLTSSQYSGFCTKPQI